MSTNREASVLRRSWETLSTRSKSKSKSKSNASATAMVGTNKIARLIKMMESMQVRMDESENKTELMAITIRTLSRAPQRKMVKNLIMKKGKMMGKEKQMSRRERKRGKRMLQKPIHN